MTRTPDDIPTWIAAACVLLVAALFVGYATYDLAVAADGGPGTPDEALSILEAKVHAAGQLFGIAPPAEPWSFRTPLIRPIDGENGRVYGKDYPGFPILLAIGITVGAEWVVNPLLAALAIVATFLLGRALRDNVTGVVAALLLASSPALFEVGSGYLNHVACMLLTTLAALAVHRSGLTGQARWAVVGGIAFGWALATRPYTAALLSLAFVPYFVWRLVTGGKIGRTAVLAFAAGVLPWIAGMLWWNQALNGDPLQTPYQAWAPDNLPAGWDARFTPVRSTRATAKMFREFMDQGFALSWTLPAAFFLPLVVIRRLRRSAFLLGIAAIVPIAGYLFYRGVGYLTVPGGVGRLYSEALPAYAILTAWAGRELFARRSRPWRWASFAIPVAFLLHAVFVSFPDHVRETGRRTDPLLTGNRILQTYLRDHPDAPRLVFVDVSTYHATSAVLVNRADFRGSDLVAISTDPEANHRIMQVFPDRAPFLFRIGAEGEIEFSPYDPEQTTSPDGP